MKLKSLKLIAKLLQWAIVKLGDWYEELDWKILANTPVGPNPHEEGSLNWYLHENGNRLAERIRLKAVEKPNIWSKLLTKEPFP